MKTLKIKKIHQSAVIPKQAHLGDAGFDLSSLESYCLQPGEGKIFKTGLAFEIEIGYVGLVWDRSSLGKRGVKTCGGVIDSSYRGEVGVILWNNSKEAQEIKVGERIAQILIQKIEIPMIAEVTELSETVRGEGGFGSTGT